MVTTWTAKKSDLDKTLEGFAAALEGSDSKAVSAMMASHDQIITKLHKDLNAIKDKPGIPYTLQRERLSGLINQASQQYLEWGQSIGSTFIPMAHQEAIKTASEHYPKLMNAAGADRYGASLSFGDISPEQVQIVTASLAIDAPLARITEQYGKAAGADMRQVLLQGLTTGDSVDNMVRDLIKASNGDLARSRARTIARTESMRAGRETLRAQMMKDSDIVKGWRWYSRRDSTCCPVCWAMHGQVFKLQTKMATHPNCRCLMLPELYTLEEMGVMGVTEYTDPSILESGASQFAKLSPAEQAQILGKGRFTLYESGHAVLKDFVADTFSDRWGYGRRTRTVREIAGKDARYLNKGELPPNFQGISSNPLIELPYGESIGDPFLVARNQALDVLDAGRVSQADYDVWLQSLNDGKFTDPTEALSKLNQLYDDTYSQVLNDTWNLYTDDLIDEQTKDWLLSDLNNMTIKQLEETRDLLQELRIAAEADQDALVAAKQDLYNNISNQLYKNEFLGYTSPGSADAAMAGIDALPLEDWVLEDLDKLWDDALQVYGDNHPRKIAQGKLDSLFHNGYISDVEYQALSTAASTMDMQKVKSMSEWADNMAAKHAPTSGDPYVLHTPFMDELTQMVNNKQIIQGNVDNIVKSYKSGGWTNQEFEEYVFRLQDLNKAGFSKNSSQLFQELDTITSLDKKTIQTLKDGYNSKVITKGELQDAIEKNLKPGKVSADPYAPKISYTPPKPSYTPPPSPPVSTPQPLGGGHGNAPLNQFGKPVQIVDPARLDAIGVPGSSTRGAVQDLRGSAKGGKLPTNPPFKKNMDGLDNLLKNQDITQGQYDNVLDLYSQGKVKNKDIEQWISQARNPNGSGGVAMGPNGIHIPPRGLTPQEIENFQWDFREWRIKDAKTEVQQWKSMTPRARQELIERYTGSEYGRMNRFMRKGDPGYGAYHDAAKEMDELLDAFDSATLPKDMRVSRGTTISKEYDWANAQAGDYLTDHGVLSTTTKRTPSFSDTVGTYQTDRVGVRSYIHVPKGAKALDVDNISRNKGEEEVVFPPGSVFKLIAKIPRAGAGPNNYDYYLEYVGWLKDEVLWRK